MAFPEDALPTIVLDVISVLGETSVVAATPEELETLISGSAMASPRYSEIASLYDLAYVDTVNRVASSLWLNKATKYAELVDTSEAGSSRKLSDLHKNAMAMSTHFGRVADSVFPVVVGKARAKTHAIVRET